MKIHNTGVDQWVTTRMIKEYKENNPYPHIVIDNFLPDTLAKDCARDFPKNNIPWQQFQNNREKKKAFSNLWELPPEHALLTHVGAYLNSEPFLRSLEKLTGESDCVGDHGFMGGGLHRIEKGGHLGIHTDFNFNPRLNRTRKINLLLFLNPEWKEEWGGHLELWDRGMKQCVKKVTPLFNRAVIFTIDDTSWHGHPHPTTSPEDVSRKSLALYYYTPGKTRRRSFHGI